MSGYKNGIRRLCIRTAAMLFMVLTVCFCSTCFAQFLRRHFVSNYIIAADKTGKEYIYRSEGISEYAGKAVNLVLGGNFAKPETVANTVSANLTFEPEKPENPVPQEPSPIVEKTSGKGDGKILVNNETTYNITDKDISGKPEFKIEDDGVQVVIVHTHATESYAPSEKYKFSHTSEDRTTDTDYNMVRIGAELKKELEEKGIACAHITSLFDYPEYSNSYARSCKAVEAELSDNPGAKIVLDLHRDSIIDAQGVKTKLTTEIDGEKVAQVMLVVGTDELGLKHDGWRTNLQFAAHFQKFLLEENAHFARPLNLRTSRFNGHTAPGAVIVEVGTGANTLDEALASVKHIANAVEGVIRFYQ